jgi:hypothetical protein
MREFWLGLGYGTVFGFSVAMVLVTAFGFGVK